MNVSRGQLVYYHGECRSAAREKYGPMSRYLRALRSRMAQERARKSIANTPRDIVKQEEKKQRVSMWGRIVNFVKRLFTKRP